MSVMSYIHFTKSTEMKRLMDLVLAGVMLLLFSPLLVLVSFAIFVSDLSSPFYISDRVGKDGVLFKMIKLRTMKVGADKTGVDSTSASDSRITRIGKYVRKYKLDELMQLWNVVRGDMSLVGPRPNVKREVLLYTEAEKLLLSVKPGITDYASVVFSDEAEVLSSEPDPDLAYNQLIRPLKSRLGLAYISHSTFFVDVIIVVATAITIFSRRLALVLLNWCMEKQGVDPELCKAALRVEVLVPSPPPGSSQIVVSRNIS